ncbi:MAG: hypothetical protein WDN24_15315 [Sphingomonas sp.]
MGRLVEHNHRGWLLDDHYAYDGLGQAHQALEQPARQRASWSAPTMTCRAASPPPRRSAATRPATPIAGTWGSGPGAWATSGGGSRPPPTPRPALYEQYDPYGRLAYRQDFGGVLGYFTYDLGGRLVSQSNDAGGSTSLAWFNTGLQAGVTAGSAVSSYSYDVDGNRLTENRVVDGVTYYQTGIATWTRWAA